LRQPLRDAPSSITVIDRELIEASGFTEIPDLLRLVPGFSVDYDSGHIPVTGYHLLHDRYVRHQQVLIDGRSVYTPLLGGVPWVDLPITIDDIERIEVVRGPNAASHGANSFLGVINIITREAALDRGSSVKVLAGSNELREGFLRHGTRIGDLDFALSLGYRADAGFEERHDGKEVRIATLRADYAPDNYNTLILQLGYNGGARDEDNAIDLAVPDHQRRVRSRYQQLRWIHAADHGSELQLQLYRTSLDEAKRFPGLDQSFFTERQDIELQHSFGIGAATRLAWGGSYRRDESRAAYYLRPEAPQYNEIYRLFANAEHHLTRQLVLNGGLMIEDNGLTGIDLLPRAGINYHISPLDTLRFSVSQATREPVLTEEYPSLGGIFYWENELAPEYITAYEIGYLGQSGDQRVTTDLKLFHERIRGLINYDRNEYFPYPHFDNFDRATLNGLEAQLTLRPTTASRIHASYAHIRARASNRVQESFYDIAAPHHNFSLLAIQHFPDQFTVSTGFYYNSGRKQLARKHLDPLQYAPSRRFDLRLAKRFREAGRSHELAAVVQNLFDDTQDTRLRNSLERRYYLAYRLLLD
jgi:iron complex outermembrane receptor protein